MHNVFNLCLALSKGSINGHFEKQWGKLLVSLAYFLEP